MANIDKKFTMTYTEVIIKWIEALQKSLGSAATWRFVSLIHGDATDYVEISQQLYQDQSIDEIYNRAKANWNSLDTKRINMYMDESEQLYPEQSMTVIISYHSVARYFSA
ncbi:MAG: hypothetical protein QNJ34_12975 [Xenococcaceae cyanobacterium MO_188.B29]|nr:hypothetical protein [Xenococcaceae cyanobacterium MO_188.B29]